MSEKLRIKVNDLIEVINNKVLKFGDNILDKFLYNIGLARVCRRFYGNCDVESIHKNVQIISDNGYFCFKCLKDYYRSLFLKFAVENGISDDMFYKLEKEINDDFTDEMIKFSFQKDRASYDKLCLKKINGLYLESIKEENKNV